MNAAQPLGAQLASMRVHACVRARVCVKRKWDFEVLRLRLRRPPHVRGRVIEL